MSKTALYTTIYPGVEQFLPDWAASVMKQTYHNFDIVVGVDGVSIDNLAGLLKTDKPVQWIVGGPGFTPAQIRQLALEEMIPFYNAVVFADSDDILEADRIESALMNLVNYDVTACGMRLIDERGLDLKMLFQFDSLETLDSVLPRFNMFGLSNSAYRTEVLRRCLPIPHECVLVDWFLATKAWLEGARMGFDSTCLMAYRQFSRNTARVIPPFSAEEILTATQLVLDHCRLVFRYIVPAYPNSVAIFEKARLEIEEFALKINRDQNLLDRYVDQLNQLPRAHLWWSCVAHPQLEMIWKN
jgi:hypothetical protein